MYHHTPATRAVKATHTPHKHKHRDSPHAYTGQQRSESKASQLQQISVIVYYKYLIIFMSTQ